MIDPQHPATDRPAPTSVPELPGRRRIERLDNGLAVCLIEHRQAPIVTTALWYLAGSRDEGPNEEGLAHFLEHMMFKGSPSYPAGEIDRRTLALGGSNNAFTSHDATAYHFQFSREVWAEALRIEADRMAELLLEAGEVDAERQVILEEIAMYENEPWEALEMLVMAQLYGEHPYGRSVLGRRESLLGVGSDELRAFHRQRYTPDNAVLVVAGDLPADVESAIEETFGALAPSGARRSRLEGLDRPAAGGRIERRCGEVARLLLAFPTCPASSEDHPALRQLITLLCSGRSSRLYRTLVEEEQLCLWVAGDVSETEGTGTLTLAAEVTPGVDVLTVERRLLEELARIGDRPPTEEEMARGRRLLSADWVFAHERVHQQALATGFAVALFDADHLRRSLRRALAVEAQQVSNIARRYLDPKGGLVVGWSMPERS